MVIRSVSQHGVIMLLWIAIVGGLTLMMGQHARCDSLFYYFRLEDQVSESPLLRLVDKHIDLGFVRYGNGEFLQWLMDRGITPYMPTRDAVGRTRSPFYGPESFTYLPESNS